ncbi:MAG TPA: glycosyltransferase family 39 protein [Hellea balneolensis]|uniref:Glycosyltransferase family 39 protein n=1 Tax=Hellea balneolensis TaxID=287478 RepID=A0A7C5R0J0_9PROT|nr:glycosyltransferase family 39 protein [Hellea balneolensis]
MSAKPSVSNDPSRQRFLLAVLIGLSVLRLLGLLASPLNLHGDEAQYWAWSQQLDWGYFSKPPMIAWVIAATTSVFGHAEWGVRISSILIHPLTAYLIYRTGRFVFNERTGVWAALVYFLMPAVWLSSGIVSTDVPLLLFWVIALNGFFHLRETPKWSWALVLGLGIGFGFLSKYAMLFFLPALLIAALVDPKSRKALISRYGVFAGILSFTILSPNIWWNKVHDFATLSHTAANANLKGVPIHPGELFEFIISQLAVFGPVTFILLALAVSKSLQAGLKSKPGLLALFVISPLSIICLEAFLSRANANWAVTAYIGGALLVGYFGSRFWRNILKWGVVFNVLFGGFVVLTGIFPTLANTIGQANGFKRLRGWPETTIKISKLAMEGHNGRRFQAIATDNRLVFYDLKFYGIEDSTGLPLYMWKQFAQNTNHADATAPLPPSEIGDPPVLLINHYDNFHSKFERDFKRLDPLTPIWVDLGGGKIRVLKTYAAYGYTPVTQGGD